MKVLITGGTGAIGKEISQQLIANGHQVVFLSRDPKANKLGIPEFKWDVNKGEMDASALEGIHSIINLAGAPINGKWTPQYKSEILRSRVDSTRLLFQTVRKEGIKLQSFISASAVGYYSSDYLKEFTEEDKAGNDFLSTICSKWEHEAKQFKLLDTRTTILRIGIVLSQTGALAEIAKPVRLGVGSPLGNGKQWMPWIHIRDVASMFVKAVENENLTGVYNATGPYSVTNAELTKACAKVLNKPLFMPNVPSFALKLLLGEMASIVLASTKVSSEKIQNAGFEYQFPKLENALTDILK